MSEVEKQTTQNVESNAEPTVSQNLKVFVGNLPFSVKDDGLKDLCKDHGEITDAQIIRFGSRSKGFGFVDYATKEQAETAVKALNGQDYQGRTLVVEIARPKEPKEPKEQRIDDSTPEQETAAPKPKTRKPRKQQKKKSQNKSSDSNKEESTQTDASAVESTPKEESNEQTQTKSNNQKNKKKQKKQQQQQQQQQRQPPKALGEPLNDSVFVNNLPFRHYQGEDKPKIPYKDQQLRELFESKGIQVEQVRVVNKSNPVTKRSRGLGFVQLKNSTDQEKAINELNGTVVGRRTITVKVAKERLEATEKQEEATEQPTEETGEKKY
ncbi:hypothetical protein E3Q17_00419 [Wallemia mellicola]|uniref:RRM domain-containing protein n=1 Tax=Wallemia mellicola TaxID=1708541 RepID=A0A4V4MMX6_9BASI|nr:hypothetical protein E3Q17_00419 [Wallemia mellicola]